MLDRAIRKKRLLRERDRINKALSLYLREDDVPNGKQPTREERQYS